MGKMTKNAGGNVKGQTSLNSFFSKQPRGGQSKLFTQVLPGSRLPSTFPVKASTSPLGNKTTDDDSDFQPRKKQKSPPAVNMHGSFKPAKLAHQSRDKVTVRNTDQSCEKHGGFSLEGEQAAKITDPSCQHQGEAKKPIKLDTSDKQLQAISSNIQEINCNDQDVSNISLALLSKTKSVQNVKGAACIKPKFQASSYHRNNREEALQESQGSPITAVIPETPEAVLNSGKTKTRISNQSNDDLTPTRNVTAAFIAFVPETPTSIGHDQPKDGTKLLSRLRHESSLKRGGVSGRGVSLGRSRSNHQQGDSSTQRDKFSSSKLLGKIAESPDLLEEMLEEFAQTAQTMESREGLTSRPKPRQQRATESQEIRCKREHSPFKIGSEGMVSVRGSKQEIGATKAQSVFAESTKHLQEHFCEPLASSPQVRCDLQDNDKQEIDPLEEMLQEYTSSSSSSSSALIRTTEQKISAQPCKIPPLGDRQMVHAKRPSYKLSRTFRKKHHLPQSGVGLLDTSDLISPVFGGNRFDTSKDEGVSDQHKLFHDCTPSPNEVDLICDNPAQISRWDPLEDLLASDSKKRAANPFALKPSTIKLKAPASHKSGNSQFKPAQVKNKLNMRKRSPSKGSSPYAKRPSTSHSSLDTHNLDFFKPTVVISPTCNVERSPQSLGKEMFHVGTAAKKSLFQEEKENVSTDVKIKEGLPSSPGASPSASPRNFEDRTNICDLSRTGAPLIQDKNSPDVRIQEKSRDFEFGGITMLPKRDLEGIAGYCRPTTDQVNDSLPSQDRGTDALWDSELDDSLLAAMDMECHGTDVTAEEKPNSIECDVTHDFNLLSPFKSASHQKKDVSLPADLHRYRVTAIKDLPGEKVLQLYCLAEHKHKVCSLKGTWSNTLVEEGDTIAVHGRFDSSGMCTVDQQNNFLVVHPDLLITGTNISRSIRCMRRSVLGEKFKGMDSASKPMLLGTMLHDVFDKAVEGKNFSEDGLIKIIDKVSHQLPYLTDMYAVGMTEQNVHDESQEYVGTMKQWADRYLQPNPKQSATIDIKMPGQHQNEKCNVCIPRVKEIEETVWSPRWGVKGKVDLTVEVKIHQRKSQGMKSQMTVPLELKTGRQTNSIEHRSQLVLYSLMLGDIQDGPPSDLGLLLYLKTGAMLAVPANHMDKRELVHLRNQLAYYIALQAKLANDGTWMLPRLPAPIEDDFTCGHCPQSVSCALFQRADNENGNAHQLSEAGQQFFADQISHMSPSHLEYFNHWYLLCALENITTEKKNQTKHIWSTEAQERELNSGGHCLSGLLMAGCRHNKTQQSYHVTFKRLPGHLGKPILDFQVSKGDRVAVSVAGTRQIATCTGFVENISSTEVTIKSERPLQSNGNKVFRMDKDDAYNSMASSLVNLAKLMHSDENAYRLRKLIVDLCEPQFEGKPQVPDSAKIKVAGILTSLNSDQQAAINAVLRCQDYTLIIGMPGTGKTTTIVALVRILCACDLSVLLTSYTHSAVDNILLKLIKFGISPLRLGEVHRVHPELESYTTKEVLGRARSVQHLASLFETKLVVATTCLGAKHALLKRRMFDVCIVDEASQISQLVCLGPLFHARRFVLVGDHRQLPPLVQSTVARQLGMDESLFQRLGIRHESTPSAAVQLSLQYRMNVDIMTLSNSLVYEGKLQCGNEEVATATLDLPKWESFRLNHCANSWVLQVLQPATTVCFLNTDKVRCPETVDDKHTVNSAEALLVKHLVNCLMKCGCPARRIGIISPYRNQCKLLGTMLDELIEVNTVDKYQGRDKEVIIVSFATKDQQFETGFLLKDIRRLNVALTRAKHKLILIGCIRALRKSGPMEHLIDSLQTANLIATLPSDACGPLGET